MKNIFKIVVLAIMVSACSKESAETQVVDPIVSPESSSEQDSKAKPKAKGHALKDYQDKIERAKQLEQNMKKHAEKQ